MSSAVSDVSGAATGDIQISPCQPRFGAEIRNIDLRQPLSPQTRDQVWQALLDYKVLFFREQNITTEQQIAFARNFGELEKYPVHVKDGYPELQALDAEYTRASIWHTDVTWRDKTACAAVLCGRVIPEVGGDTMWADGERAYENLPDDLKEQIDNLYAVHDPGMIGANYVKGAQGHEERLAKVRELRRKHPQIAHPIVRTHPETGRPCLFLNPALVTCIVGMNYAESKVLLDKLHAEYLRPENTLRFRWTPNAVAMWDERNTLHYGVNDYGNAARRVERVLISGKDIPYR